MFFQGHKKGKISQPVGFFFEFLECFADFLGGRFLKSDKGPVEEAQLIRDHGPKINFIEGKIHLFDEVVWMKQIFSQEHIGTHEERVAGKSGKALVGRIAIPGGPQGQHLPD